MLEKSYQQTGETTNRSSAQPNVPGRDLTNIEERETPYHVENLDHGKNFHIAPNGEHSTHLPEGAGGLITYNENEPAQERSKGTMMISASRSTIQDPETSKNVCLLKTMTSTQKDEKCDFQNLSLKPSIPCPGQYLDLKADISKK